MSGRKKAILAVGLGAAEIALFWYSAGLAVCVNIGAGVVIVLGELFGVGPFK